MLTCFTVLTVKLTDKDEKIRLTTCSGLRCHRKKRSDHFLIFLHLLIPLWIFIQTSQLTFVELINEKVNE